MDSPVSLRVVAPTFPEAHPVSLVVSRIDGGQVRTVWSSEFASTDGPRMIRLPSGGYSAEALVDVDRQPAHVTRGTRRRIKMYRGHGESHFWVPAQGEVMVVVREVVNLTGSVQQHVAAPIAAQESVVRYATVDVQDIDDPDNGSISCIQSDGTFGGSFLVPARFDVHVKTVDGVTLPGFQFSVPRHWRAEPPS